ncbi:MAG: hypothetical protein KDM81_04540, partial [Verrucomicrobiae bacterium]|nr:hypothetical protein [Verrucomicrobiae bacterium]
IPPGVERLLQLAELRLQAGAKQVEILEVRGDKLMITRRGDYVMVGGRFPRLRKPGADGRLREIASVLRAL